MAIPHDSGTFSISSSEADFDITEDSVPANDIQCSSITSTSTTTTEPSTITKQSHSQQSKCTYDFTLWYDSADEEDAQRIIDYLEVKHQLKGFIEDRDFRAGASKFSNINRGIENSDKILVIISTASLASPWFEKKVHDSLASALEDPERKSSVIPIYIDVKKPKIPRLLKCLAGVNFTAKHFWDRLRLTLGLPPKPELSSEHSIDIV